MSVLVVGSVALDDIEAPAGSAKSVLGGAASYFGVAYAVEAMADALRSTNPRFDRDRFVAAASKG